MFAARCLLIIALAYAVAAITPEICQLYCSSVNGGLSYDNCSPWTSWALYQNQTCYNICYHNCLSKYDGKCMTGNGYRCCLPTTPAKTNQFKRSGCNYLYNNVL